MFAQQIPHVIPLLVILLVFVVALAVFAERLKTPYPIVLVIGGLIISQIPHLPQFRLNPNIVFLVILPPLIFSGAFLTSWRDFRYHLSSILLLAFGLVIFTVFGIGLVAHTMLPGFDWRTGLVLGAVVSPTDPVAAISIAKRLGLPKHVTDLIEGESLVNDATGLLALQFATGLVVTQHIPTASEGALRFLYLVFGSIAIGLVLGRIIHEVEKRIANAPIEILISLMAPYFAYLGAEEAHASGVMATVACGLYLGHRSSAYFSIDARLQAAAVWNTLIFVLNGIVFILIGLQLPYIRSGITGLSVGTLLGLGLLFSAIVIALRLMWMYPAAGLVNWLEKMRRRPRTEFPNRRYVFLVGWTGMRGVLALAAAFALPEMVESGRPFPQRNAVIFLTFSVIFVTLVLQGLTLPMIIRRLGLAGVPEEDPEELEARRVISKAALNYLEDARQNSDPAFGSLYDELERRQRRRLTELSPEPDGEQNEPLETYQHLIGIAHEMRTVQRAALQRMHRENKINDEAFRKLEHELDLLEARLPSTGHL
ncbi:MAG TPA: Na+/H+ antiporter [Candidatus Acidoferrales bacterium]|jgi:CPA1 family monovalent cation:H+ antiporter|nr:Na+/H+ antiporter [Candidatus Acidoferrales bacterium]